MIGVQLSETEQEVLLALIACPEGNEAMAERLNMTRGGVWWHLNNLYQKTGTTNKIQLLRWALREAYRAQRIAGRTQIKTEGEMNLFQAEVHIPNSDDPISVAEAMMIVATPIVNVSEQQPAAKAFVLSVTEETLRVEAIRNDGGTVFARLRFDGQRFTLVSEGPV